MALRGLPAGVCAALVAFLSVSAAAGAPAPQDESGTAAIEGHVHAIDGSAVPSATVVVQYGDGVIARLSVDAVGLFRCERLAAGDDYVVRAEAGGYRTVRLGPLRLRPGESVPLDISLIAQVSEHATAGPFDASATSTTSRYDSGFIEKLPIIGHDYQEVLTLAPGVDDPDGDGNPNVHGARDTGLEYLLDRGDTTDPATGFFGMNLNPLSIEQIEIITAGAPADHGRALGGFAQVTTRTGGNDFQGELALYWRGRALDGDGAGNQDAIRFHKPQVEWHDFRAAVRVGGPIRKDSLWYFGTYEKLDSEQATGLVGPGAVVLSRGAYYFGKMTWQADAANKVGFQIGQDPRTFEGLGLTQFSAAGSGYRLDHAGVAAQLDWTSALSPDILLEVAATHLGIDVVVDPESDFFRPAHLLTFTIPTSPGSLVALYPCDVVNCSEAAGERSVYRVNGFTGRTSGPFFQRDRDERTREGLTVDLTWKLDGRAGTHTIKGGYEAAQEQLRRDDVLNPILYDLTSPRLGAPPGSQEVTGFQFLQAVVDLPEHREVSGLSNGFYLMDSWKPWPRLAVNAGARFDREDLQAGGFRPFDPRTERRRSIALWRHVCDEAVSQNAVGGTSNCSPLVTYDGSPPSNITPLRSFDDRNMDGVNDVPPDVVALDLNRDGTIEVVGIEGAAQFKHFTTLTGRQSGPYQIDESHLSPRIGVSWDPWGDGQTRLFGHWGRYYDRILPEVALVDDDGASFGYSFVPDMNHIISPGAPAVASSLPTIRQVDHDLRAPRTDELTLGVERAVGVEWTLGATYIRRQTRDQLQDTDLNHYTCRQAGTVIGIDPQAICGSMGTLQRDRFGAPGFGSFSFPNGVEDLYTANVFFNQVLRVGNVDTSEYKAYELKAVRRLHRNWQMQASYTWSKATGDAESSFSQVGNDPSSDREEGFLDYDQRHRLKLQVVSHLPSEVILSGAIAWSSGTPYSVIKTVPDDQDSQRNVTVRQLLPTGQRNDQRNESSWQLDARIEKRFRFKRVETAGFLIAQNLLNRDYLVITSVQSDGTGVVATRDFGRRFEIGALLDF